MNITSININPIYSIKNISKDVSVPSFKSCEQKDTFVKSSESVNTIQGIEEIKASIPEYLYHLTNDKNYKKIQETGKIKLSQEKINGVFLFDMKDFQKNWRTTKNVSGSHFLAEGLVGQAIKEGNGLVLLKIPTKNLDPNKIVIRPEDEILMFAESERYANSHKVVSKKQGIFSIKLEKPKGIVEGYSPIEAKKYFEANRPIEYVYKDTIDISTNEVEAVLERQNITLKTIWGYGIKNYNDLFDSFLT